MQSFRLIGFMPHSTEAVIHLRDAQPTVECKETNMVFRSLTFVLCHIIMYLTEVWSRPAVCCLSSASSFEAFCCCRLFGADVQGRDCGDLASDWLGRFLTGEKRFRLVHFEPQLKMVTRLSSETFIQVVAYPDYGPMMLLSEASIQDLNSRLGKEIKPEQFRPNIVISGCKAFDEVTERRFLCVQHTFDPQ
uniref:MOSC domain-containing protein n=1 Tax=Oryzias sinensis TaxID=183150 RepID=A0A8C7WUK1_9TELE